ncbi:MAG: hypothetical protein HYZ44_17630 [Bacteroidetes bacterium]|nr:hypothetical protein [Bacteroidota bacterium]
MIPERIPILREEDYHTHFLGKTEDGRQFFGYETFVFPNGMPASDWEKHRNEYAVLYIFDKEGNHLVTNHWCAGTTSETNQPLVRKKLEEMISELGNIEFSNIEVKPFQTVIDGVVFGLVPNEEYDTVDLEPSSTISFHEPWDGEYDT